MGLKPYGASGANAGTGEEQKEFNDRPGRPFMFRATIRAMLGDVDGAFAVIDQMYETPSYSRRWGWTDA
jgi:hypothetical protein